VIQPTPFIDSDHPSIIEFARSATAGATTDRERASRLFLAVREHSRYDPYTISTDPEEYRASTVLTRDRAYCIPKAVLLAAAARAVGIPAWVGFADVMNHLTSEKLRQTLQGHDLYIWHGFTALEVDGKVWKVTPAFNAALCERFGVPALEFDGEHDALLQPFDGRGRQYMEYKADRGLFEELPLVQILDDFRTMYGIGASTAAIHDEAFH
jgi:transglutaminase-like putative cysteine protease